MEDRVRNAEAWVVKEKKAITKRATLSALAQLQVSVLAGPGVIKGLAL